MKKTYKHISIVLEEKVHDLYNLINLTLTDNNYLIEEIHKSTFNLLSLIIKLKKRTYKSHPIYLIDTELEYLRSLLSMLDCSNIKEKIDELGRIVGKYISNIKKKKLLLADKYDNQQSFMPILN